MENRTLGPTKSIPPCSKNLELVFWVLNGTAGVIMLSGNFITILVLVTNRRLRQNYVNIFLVNLAVADLMMAVFVIPGYAVFCNGCNKYALSKHCWILAGIKDVAFGSTVFNLAAISFDRFLAVLWPLHYYNYMTTEKKRQSYFNWGVGFQYLSGQLTTRVASYEARKRGAKSR